jgi:hypothetical protein
VRGDSVRHIHFVIPQAAMAGHALRAAGACVRALALACALSGAPAESGQVYVAPGGSDAGAGTRAEPFATIARALGMVSGHDTVFVLPGTYAESVSIAQDYVTLFSVKRHGAILDGGGGRRPASGRRREVRGDKGHGASKRRLEYVR